MSGGFGFSRVYMEESLIADAEAEAIVEKLQLPVIRLGRYQELFNRGGQRFQHQKRNPALILARKEGTFLYTGSERIRSFGDQRVRYVDQLRNCVYNCDYCFLQGMHRSAHILMHLNGEDYQKAVRAAAAEAPIYLSISYLTDILAFERLHPFTRRWINFAAGEPGVELEIRTKSDNVPAILSDEPPPNAILVFSLSPDPVARAVEKGTAAFQSRLLHARQASRRGWRIRLCFDPILAVPGWKEIYASCIEETFRRLEARRVEEVSLGVFRIHPDYLKRMQKERRDLPILYHPFARDQGVVTYEEGLREEMTDYIRRELLNFIPEERITTVHG